MRLRDKVAVITGGGRGIGRATALRFVADGALVVIADLDTASAHSVAAEADALVAQRQNAVQTQVAGREREVSTESNGHAASAIDRSSALAHFVDVVDTASCQALIAAAVAQFGRVDIMVNNAGIVRDAQLVKMTEEQFDSVIDVNLRGVFNCAQAVAPIMIEQGSGVILSTASVVAANGNFGQTNYVASKAGVVGMTKVWARELGRKGIRVNAVAPGFIRTRLTDDIPEKVMQTLRSRIPLGVQGEPLDIANAFLWLASDEARYVTGHVLAVDGGAVV